ncbi:TPA: DUF551 domain-containing protein [Enterobacter kobei]
MSTITRELAKLFRKITNSEIDAEGNAHVVLSPADSLLINNARIALASLEAEPVAWLLSGGGAKNNVSFDSGNAYADPLREVTPLYTAPPAPISVPDPIERNDADGWWMYKGRRVGGGCAEWYNRALDDCRAAMLQGADGNSPVTQDGWVDCGERMPDEDGNYWGWWSESKRQGPVWFIKSELQAQFQSSEITHWMPLPAAPRQEVK